MLKNMLCPKGMTCASVSDPKICSVLAGWWESIWDVWRRREQNRGFLAHVDNILLFYRLVFIFA